VRSAASGDAEGSVVDRDSRRAGAASAGVRIVYAAIQTAAESHGAGMVRPLSHPCSEPGHPPGIGETGRERRERPTLLRMNRCVIYGFKSEIDQLNRTA